jgi:hypothetical protein
VNELLQLTQKMQQLRAQIAHLLDEQSNQKRITQTERRKPSGGSIRETGLHFLPSTSSRRTRLGAD